MYEIFSQLLQKHGITRYAVSKATGVSQSTLSAWRTGVSIPKVDKIKKIADYFNVSVEYLLTGNEPQTNKKPTLSESELLDEELSMLLEQVPESQLQRVKDFVQGLLSC